MTEAGYTALIIAFTIAVVSAAALLIGVRDASGRLGDAARKAVVTVFGFYTLAFVLILVAFFTRDYSLKIVAEHAANDLPTVYTLSALYSDKAGSMFFWGWLISLFTVVLVVRDKGGNREVINRALAVTAIVQAFYLALVTFGSNVFEKLQSPPADGYGLNPLLQNIGMLVHPPLLYLGFAGFAVVFALTVASLADGRNGKWWSRRVRHWTVFSWCVLGIGNLVGMWWSYNELGWGGYWAWDPVENAGLMPWLLGTAFLHSISIGRQRGYLQIWSVVLIILTFAFTLLSPFITHGGIESPLHGFYGSPFPPYILAAIVVIIVGSLLLLYVRRANFGDDEKPASLCSREGSFQLTNIILVILVLIMLAGTVLPRIVEAFGGTKIAIDRSFFDRACGPVMLALVFLMGICPLLGWGKSGWRTAGRKVIWSVLAAAVVAAVILVSGIGNWYIASVTAGGLIVFVIFREWYHGIKARSKGRGEGCVRAFFSLIGGNRARYGGFLAHIGIMLITLGIIASSFYGLEKTETLDVGETMNVGDYELIYNELLFSQDNTKVSAVADITVKRDGHTLGDVRPSFDYWFSHQDSFAEVAVRTTPAEDLFVSLIWTMYDPEDKSAAFRVLVNPLVVWIWVGGGFFLLGGAVSFTAKIKEKP
jgi:cytochrome c-type biogenesis protein CcmF